jgi:hypothetical protein
MGDPATQERPKGKIRSNWSFRNRGKPPQYTIINGPFSYVGRRTKNNIDRYIMCVQLIIQFANIQAIKGHRNWDRYKSKGRICGWHCMAIVDS